MRAIYSNKIESGNQVHFEFEGKSLTAYPEDSVAAALIANDIVDIRITQDGTKRGVFCGMGVCQDCLVEIDGTTNQRACMTKVTQGMKIKRQQFPGAPSITTNGSQTDIDIKKETPDLLVIGGGVGGMSAASAAAENGMSVILIDERPRMGGQYAKQPTVIHANSSLSTGDKQIQLGRTLIERMKVAGVQVIKDGQVWAGFPNREILVIENGRNFLYTPKYLIVATGAYERGMPIEGWTLPGVMTTGAAQSMLRTYHVLAGKKIFIAGNGPFNLQVALELETAGAQIVGVAESAKKPNLGSIGSIFDMYRGAPDLLFQGLKYLRQLKRNKIPLMHNCNLSSIQKIEGGLISKISSGQAKTHTQTIRSDIVCMGYGFLPSNALLRSLGCEHHYNALHKQLVVNRSPNFETTVTDVYAVGDCAGLGGAFAACEEGTIAGLHVVTTHMGKLNTNYAQIRLHSQKTLSRHRRFQSGLWRLYSAKLPNAKEAATPTHICRCELVTIGQIREVIKSGCRSISEIKQQTRAGMGRCQGRYCASLLVDILATESDAKIDESKFFAPRVPISPIRIKDINRY